MYVSPGRWQVRESKSQEIIRRTKSKQPGSPILTHSEVEVQVPLAWGEQRRDYRRLLRSQCPKEPNRPVGMGRGGNPQPAQRHRGRGGDYWEGGGGTPQGPHEGCGDICIRVLGRANHDQCLYDTNICRYKLLHIPFVYIHISYSS